MGMFHPPAHVFYLHQICAMSRGQEKKRWRGDFIAPETSFSLFMSLLWVYSGSPTTDQTVFHVSSLEEISSSAMAAAFEDIFNNSDHQFVDICPVSVC